VIIWRVLCVRMRGLLVATCTHEVLWQVCAVAGVLRMWRCCRGAAHLVCVRARDHQGRGMLKVAICADLQYIGRRNALYLQLSIHMLVWTRDRAQYAHTLVDRVFVSEV